MPHSPRDLFHRLRSPTQGDGLAALQQRTGRICGRTPFGGNLPTVQAYRGSLPPRAAGIEFRTEVAPTPGTGTPYEARWRAGSPGVIEEGADMVCIPVIITRNTQVA